MPNTIELAKKFIPVLDAKYRMGSLTSLLDGQTSGVNFTNAATVEVLKIGTVGLGNYSRSGGYPVGAVTATWEALTLAQSRGREFNIDRMDNEETFGLTVGASMNAFMDEGVIPEIDAYRFAKYASAAGVGSATGTLTKDTVLAAIDAASEAMDDKNVPQENRILFTSFSVKRMIEQAINRQLTNENRFDRRIQSLDELAVVAVPQNRFYTQITLDPGATESAGGYTKTATTGADINFMMIHRDAVLQVVKVAMMKTFDADTNQTLDAFKFQYRLYHDAFVYDNKQDGVYVHKKAAA